MAMARRLVITADDLGLDPGTNATIVALLRDHLISATTLIPVAPAVEDALDRLRANDLPSPRLHFSLSSERNLPPWRPLAPDVASLTTPESTFPMSPAVAEHQATEADVARELLAELQWMHAHDQHPQALDSHSGTLYGLYGRSLALIALAFCAEHDLAFRLPRTLPAGLALAVRGLAKAHRVAVDRADELQVRLPERLVSSWLPGRLLLSYTQLRAEVLHQLRRLPPGTSELIVHPAPRSVQQFLSPAEARKRWWELRLLRDPTFHRFLRREGIVVVPAW